MKRLVLLMVALAAFAFSCSVEENVAPTQDVPEAIKAAVLQAGFDNSDIISFRDGYLVEGDIYLTEEMIANMELPLALSKEHFRTTNTVTGLPRTISVYMDVNFGSFMQSSFDAAIARYNAENLELTFVRASGPGADIDINAFFEQSNTLGFSAGFPTAGGDPASGIGLNTFFYNDNNQRADATIVIAHEIGHAIGFRHTDYFDRSISCGGRRANEGSAGVGAIAIPGTPTRRRDVRRNVRNGIESWMLSCSDGQDRPFTVNDVTALNELY